MERRNFVKLFTVIVVGILSVFSRPVGADSATLFISPGWGVVPFSAELTNSLYYTSPPKTSWTTVEIYLREAGSPYWGPPNVVIGGLNTPLTPFGPQPLAFWTSYGITVGTWEFRIKDKGRMAISPYNWELTTNTVTVTGS